MNLHKCIKCIIAEPDNPPQAFIRQSLTATSAIRQKTVRYERITHISHEPGRQTDYDYDGLARLVGLIQADPDGGGPLAKPQTGFAYDAAGNLLLQTDPLGRPTAYEYDRLDRLVAVRQADGGVPTAGLATAIQGSTASEVQRVGFSDPYAVYGGTFTLTFDG